MRIMKIYQPGASYHHVLQWMFVFVSIFMVPTLSNQKITSPILLDLFLMAFFSSLLFSSLLKKPEKKLIMIRSQWQWQCITTNTKTETDRGGLVGFCCELMRCETTAKTVSSVQSHLITQSPPGSRSQLLRLSS